MSIQIEKLKITIPEGVVKLEVIESIIKLCERRGCTTETNPHIKPEKVETQDEEQKVRQILGIYTKP